MQVLFGILGTIETKKRGLIVHDYELVNFLSQDVENTIAFVMDLTGLLWTGYITCSSFIKKTFTTSRHQNSLT